ncbi:ionotropic receptor 21a-like [Macrobrachium rosenbergii]|uniref:ionotropic receptor 21a-like n=1 Tax=Macrobrachium rosenbergii TaxID=79674 RepID=UPI0034D413EC
MAAPNRQRQRVGAKSSCSGFHVKDAILRESANMINSVKLWRFVYLHALVAMTSSRGSTSAVSATCENREGTNPGIIDQPCHDCFTTEYNEYRAATLSSKTSIFGASQQERIVAPLLNSQWNDKFPMRSEEAKGMGPSLSKGVDESLGEILQDVFDEYLRGCSVVLAYDLSFQDSLALDGILQLPSPKQIIEVESRESFKDIAFGGEWTCRAYVFLLRRLDVLIDFANTEEGDWDFDGKYMLAGTAKDDLERFVTSMKGRKTQNIVGIIKGNRAHDWGLYTNRMYSDRPLQLINTWKSGEFKFTPGYIFSDKISNLRGAVLKVVTFEWEPSVLYFRDRDGRMVYPFGIDIEVVSAIASVLNVSLQFVEPPPGELWGIATENGSWNGMVGKLSKNEGDIGVANLFLTLGRFGAIDYSAPYDAEVSCFLARTSPPAPKWKSLSLPFQMNVWIVILVGIIICGPVLYFLALASDKCGGEVKIFQSFLYSGMYSMGLHFRQTLMALPNRTSTQVYVSFLGLYTFILTTAYGSNLTAFLTVVQTPSGIETVKDLYQSGVEVSGLGGFFKGALASSVDPYLQGLANRFEAYGDLSLVWPKVLNGKSVYLHNRQFLEFVIATQFTNKGVSSVRIMKECFSPYNIAMALQRHSPLKGKVDQVIGWILETGLVRRWFLESFRQARKIQESRKAKQTDGSGKGPGITKEEEEANKQPSGESATGVIPLTIDHLQGSFFILVFGYLLSVLFFGFEVCCLRGPKSTRSPKSPASYDKDTRPTTGFGFSS